jgi:hypothetical protein
MWFRNALVGGVVLAALVAGPADAAVRLVVRGDGTKVIYNVPGRRPGNHATDYAWLAKQRDRKSPYDSIIERHCRARAVDPVLVKAVIQVESGFNPNVVSHKGACGLMQLMPATARRFGVSDPFDAEENIRGGVAYLAVLMDLFPTDLTRVLAGYNAGENAVIRFGGVPPYDETETYVRRALTVFHGRPYGTISFGTSGKLKGGFRQTPAAPDAQTPARARVANESVASGR